MELGFLKMLIILILIFFACFLYSYKIILLEKRVKQLEDRANKHTITIPIKNFTQEDIQGLKKL